MLTSSQYRIRLETMGTPCDSLLLPERERDGGIASLNDDDEVGLQRYVVLGGVEIEKWINNRQ